MSQTRVVITGIGPITGFGLGMEPLWKALLAGESAIGPIQRFDPAGFPSKFAAEVSDDDFNVRKIVPRSHRKAAKVMCRDIELAVGAAAAAVADAGLITRAVDADVEPTIPPARFGCHIGAGLISADVDELTAALVTSRNGDGKFDLTHWGAAGMENLTPLWLLKYLPNMLACHVTIVHDCRGPSNTITCCESSSALSLGESMRVIQRGDADACLTGGAESRLNPMGFLRQHLGDRLADTETGEDAHGIVRPFSAEARGTVLGEGGGILVIESTESAEGRGAMPYAEITGFASTQSYCPDTVGLRIDESGESIADAIDLALVRAGVTAADVDALVPFASSIPVLDRAEANAYQRVFGDIASSVPLITTIPNVGNCCAGNGAIGLAVAARCLREQRLPARIGFDAGDGVSLDCGPCLARAALLTNILVISTAQGGQNTAVVLRRAEG